MLVVSRMGSNTIYLQVQTFDSVLTAIQTFLFVQLITKYHADDDCIILAVKIFNTVTVKFLPALFINSVLSFFLYILPHALADILGRFRHSA